GKVDLVVPSKQSSVVNLLLGNGNGTFGGATTFGVGDSPAGVTVTDVSGDGRPDLVTANYGSNNLSVLLGNGNGTFLPAVSFAVGTNPSINVAARDVNGDGLSDLLTANRSSDTVSVLLNQTGTTTAVTSTGPFKFGNPAT